MPEIFEKEQTVEQWDIDYYHPISLRLYDQAIPDMLQLMGVHTGATVLDAGCGPGVHSIRVAKAGFRVCAIDISETMLQHAKERAAAAGMNNRIEFHRKDLTQLDFSDNSLGYVFSWGVLIHIPEAEKALDELARVVKPGGKLALYLTNKTALDHKIEWLARIMARKPLIGMEQLPLGDGIWYDMNDEKLWVWRIHADALTEYLRNKGFHLKHRRIGELSELHLRLRGFARTPFLHLNNVAYRLNWPPSLACTNLFVFEKKNA